MRRSYTSMFLVTIVFAGIFFVLIVAFQLISGQLPN